MASHSFLLFLFLRPIQAGPVLAQQAFCFSAKGILNMTATTNALSTAATGSSQGYAAQSCSPQQASGTPTSSINSKIMMTTSGLP